MKLPRFTKRFDKNKVDMDGFMTAYEEIAKPGHEH